MTFIQMLAKHNFSENWEGALSNQLLALHQMKRVKDDQNILIAISNFEIIG